MNCLLVINTLSGNAARTEEKEIIRKYAAEDSVRVRYLRDPSDGYDVEGVEKLIVCGGDGTLHHAINLCRGRELDLYYLPCGTFNETAKSVRGKGVIPLAPARIGTRDFAYVAAAGSFTSLGRLPDTRAKRRFKILAYLMKVLSAYRVHRIHAAIRTDEVTREDDFTLLMLSNAPRCFGFRFNRLHKKEPQRLQLLAIKAPERDNLWGRIKMFFPFFRAFFLGFSEPHIGKSILFTSIDRGELILPEQTEFCLDGESVLLSGSLPFRKEDNPTRIFLIKE